MVITSTAVQANGELPVQYTCEGDNDSPPLAFNDIPPGTESLLLIMDDQDAPAGVFTHWVIYDIDPATTAIAENDPAGTGLTGANSFGKVGYDGPCPPAGTHRYAFTLYALDTTLGLAEGESRETVERAMDGHVLDSAQLTATFSKSETA